MELQRHQKITPHPPVLSPFLQDSRMLKLRCRSVPILLIPDRTIWIFPFSSPILKDARWVFQPLKERSSHRTEAILQQTIRDSLRHLLTRDIHWFGATNFPVIRSIRTYGITKMEILTVGAIMNWNIIRTVQRMLLYPTET